MQLTYECSNCTLIFFPLRYFICVAISSHGSETDNGIVRFKGTSATMRSPSTLRYYKKKKYKNYNTHITQYTYTSARICHNNIFHFLAQRTDELMHYTLIYTIFLRLFLRFFI